MKIRILGSGSSFGVPLIGDRFGICDKNNTKNYRLRPSILIKYKNKNLLIDSGPDLRAQLLKCNCSKIDAVLYTHTHADHVHGINDLRAITMIFKNKIQAWGSEKTIKYLLDNFTYIFKPIDNYKPIMDINIIKDRFFIDDIKITSFEHNHGNVDCTTYRIGNFAYTTDIKKFYNDGSIDKLVGIEKWVIGCLRMDPHPSHANFEEVVDFVKYIKPKKAYLTHLTGFMDYEKLLEICPDNIEPAYDNLEFDVN